MSRKIKIDGKPMTFDTYYKLVKSTVERYELTDLDGYTLPRGPIRNWWEQHLPVESAGYLIAKEGI